MNVKQAIKDLKIKFPTIEKINIEYNGSGDSFNDFWNLESIPESNIEQEDVEDLLWYAIDNSEANFNNEGSEGEIIIDLVNEKLSIDNYWIVYEREPSGLKEIE
jgi:hypothetical protein